MNEIFQQASIHAANDPLLYECVVRKNTGYKRTGVLLSLQHEEAEVCKPRD